MTRRFLVLLAVGLFVATFSHAQTVVLTMTEVPTQPVNGLTVQGIKFTFTIGGAASADALYNMLNGGQLRWVQDPSLEGNAAGTLQIDFPQGVGFLRFGVARSTNATLTPGLTVQLYDTALVAIDGPINVSTLVSIPGGFSEGLFVASPARAIGRAVLTFPNAVAATRFAIDNLTATYAVAGSGPFLVGYMSRLDLGDSYINVTNTGTQVTANGTLTNVCANVYVFSPDEQLVSCCSCVVTPNALVSLSGKNDLVSNTLTPASPTSVVVKMLATAGTGCNAASVPVANLADGLVAWRTSLHAKGAAPAMGETRFSEKLLSAAELARMTSLCGFIQTNGSGYGICRSCRLGGLGAVAK